jgi:histidine triad (HIT) family protein
MVMARPVVVERASVPVTRCKTPAGWSWFTVTHPQAPYDRRMADCLFCRIIAGEIPATVVHEDQRTVAFRDLAPQAPTHVLVVPRAHVVDAAALAGDPELLAAVVRAGTLVAAAEGVDATGYRFVLNSGADAGQTVLHAHLHVLGGGPLGQFGATGDTRHG